MKRHVIIGAYILLLGACIGARSQAISQGVLSQPVEDAVSPKLLTPLGQDTPASGGQPGYGSVVSSVLPVNRSVGALLFSLPNQTNQAPQPVPLGASSFSGHPSVARASASSWIAGASAVTGSAMLPGGANSVALQAYTSASQFAPKRDMPTQPGGASNASALTQIPVRGADSGMANGAAPLGMPLGGSSGLSALTAKPPASVLGNSPGVELLVKTAKLFPGASTQSPGLTSQSGASIASPGDIVPQQGQHTGSYQGGVAKAAHSASSATPGRQSNKRPVFASATSEGMIIRLFPTADGLQLVLQTKNNLAGSVLSDQSAVSRNNANSAGDAAGWWSWKAGAGSWSPINVTTSSPRATFKDPTEKMLKRLGSESGTSQLDKKQSGDSAK